MINAQPVIKCKKCGTPFKPDMKAKEAWPCPSCQAKNPNLKRHYRSVADLCVLGLIATAAVVAVRLSRAGLNLSVVLTAGQGVLLLVTIVFVYRSQSPWTDRTAKTLIWSVFSLAFLSNVLAPFVLIGLRCLPVVIPFLVVYAVVFSYLFWLRSQAVQCTVSGSPDLPAGGGSERRIEP